MISYRESQLLDLINKPTEITSYGTKKWKNKEGKYHRGNDKPAVEWVDGRKDWYINGLRHRENDKPAIEYSDGSKLWYINGKFIKQNYDEDFNIHNDKFFDSGGVEIKTKTAQLKDMIKPKPGTIFEYNYDRKSDEFLLSHYDDSNWAVLTLMPQVRNGYFLVIKNIIQPYFKPTKQVLSFQGYKVGDQIVFDGVHDGEITAFCADDDLNVRAVIYPTNEESHYNIEIGLFDNFNYNIVGSYSSGNYDYVIREISEIQRKKL
jgi:hypothetical protein